METVDAREVHEIVDGQLQFQRSEGIVRNGNDLFMAKWPTRVWQNDEPAAFYDVCPLRNEDRGPEAKPHWTIVAVADVNGRPALYLKTPKLLDYLDDGLENHIAMEIQIWEFLRQNPHPNIATYHGCVMDANMRVSALCFTRYRTTLLNKCNPEGLGKREYMTGGNRPSLGSLDFDGLLAGIQHLHSLGLVHNDISPTNIMVSSDCGTEGETAARLVLIDFESCRPTGTSLTDTDVRRTHEWYDPAVTTAQVENDLGAFEELKTWLYGSVSELRF